jgi:hypothetical protein
MEVIILSRNLSIETSQNEDIQGGGSNAKSLFN